MIRFVLSAWLWMVSVTLLSGCSDGSDGHHTVAGPVTSEEADQCDLPADDIPVSTTESNIDYVRTPDACFEALDGYPFAPNYVEVESLRYHYLDEGPRDGEVVLMLHGQPTWSYLYRKMIPVLVDADFRVITPDHIGMGRSDKPIDPRVHQYEQHVAWIKSFVSELDLTDVTLFVQDWGSLIGLRVAGDMPERIARIVVANGDMPIIPPGLNPFVPPVFELDETQGSVEEFFAEQANAPGSRPERFQLWIDYAATAPLFSAGEVVEVLTSIDISGAEQAAYDAPYPSEIYRAAVRAFPSMVAGIEDQNLPAWRALGEFDRPFMFLAGEHDQNMGSKQNQDKWIAHVPGSVGQDHRRYEEAGHFIQEDVGAEMAAHVVDFMQRTPIPEAGPRFNVRYCEIIMPFFEEGGIRARVYGTQQLNDCPQGAWDAINPAAVAAQYGAIAALKNGPRYWVLDDIEVGEEGFRDDPLPGVGEISVFGELEMRLLTTVVLQGGAGGQSPAPYAIARVDRNTIFHFVAGRRVYELQDPEGQRYMMQSFSQIVDPELQRHDLARLGERLELPEGWQFTTYILENPFDLLTVGGIAEVVQDDLSNTYQRIP